MRTIVRRLARRGAGAAALASVCALGACDLTDPGEDEAVRRTYEVAPHKVVCTGEGFRFCLQVRTPGTTEWGFAYDVPQGFEFEWGVTQRIVVDERNLENPPEDGSSVERTLVRVEARTSDPADSLFTLLVPGPTATSPTPGLHALDFGSESFLCDAGPDCDGLAAALDGTDAVEVTLVLGAESTDPFRVVDWRACGSPWPSCGGG